jgi:DNA-binding NarL/FixJ family response regulator
MSTALLTRNETTTNLTNDVTIDITGAEAIPAALSSLSPTELRVARLVAEGLTNRQIGERLFVSHRTVDTHVSHLFSKLNVTSRLRLALVVGA